MKTTDELIELTTSFMDLIERENILLRSFNPNSLQGFQIEKIAYLSDYEKLLEKFKMDDEKNAESFEKLRRISKQFWEVVQENYRLLATIEQINRRILEDIYQEVSTVNTGYEPDGKSNVCRLKIPFAIDRRI